jgi:hypothetical protein
MIIAIILLLMAFLYLVAVVIFYVSLRENIFNKEDYIKMEKKILFGKSLDDFGFITKTIRIYT